ncbi:uncharacterized protein N7518_010023 [Penicillium psychrosexuale]|uniref:uncharacterized protein n=1 Tax=Penicillium psychrosexuale TaxID=1002107 RepID=UPI00254536EC|nr:uncharacterized protein N7518_010023 [Penicillium psychrosexuale]KAJ5781540.1 hypothetical protein N7518_010023 [Penicillium psychrosexuale]
MGSTGPKPKVLRLGSIDLAQAAWNALGEVAQLVESAATTRAEFIQECKDGKLDGVVAIYRTVGSLSQTGLVDEELVNVLPSSLRYIAHCVRATPRFWFPMSQLQGTMPLPDVNMFLILGALRNFNTGMNALREGKWHGHPAPPLGHGPQRKVLGILGMGGIGRNLKKKAEAFGMKVIYHNRRKLSDEMSAGAKYVSFDELLSTSDVISLNLPLNKNTRHIIGKAEFAKMKDGVVVVNTARGAVMDEAALVDALDSGKVFSAGLDVFEEEPRIHPGLLSNQSVILVPHMGTWTSETFFAKEEWTIENIRMALEVGKLKSPVPEQADL